jgi:two-component system alkaline phosphatase synthesis response regulator PhoP
VDAAEDGAVAWDTLQLNGYDLMVTDNSMPRVSGVDLLKKLQTARMPMPVIMATGSVPEEEFAQNPGIQPAATLLKPYTIAELLETVKDVLHAAAGARAQLTLPLPNWQSQPPAGAWQLGCL